MRKFVFCDFETRSKVDLPTAGLVNYAQNAEALILSWCVDKGKVKRHEFRGTKNIPPDIDYAIEHPEEYVFVAWNAPFERLIFKYALGIEIPIERWLDVKVLARSWSLSGGLEEVGERINLPTKFRKDKRGEELIELFSMPAREQEEDTLFGKVGVFNDWNTHPAEWLEFCKYCDQDVVAERALWYMMLELSPLPEREWRGWHLDQKINDYGMPFNRTMVTNALALAEQSKQELNDEIRTLTGVDNPNSPDQIKAWLKGQNYPWGSIIKNQVNAELADPQRKTTELGCTVLKLRQQASKNSYTKLQAILDAGNADDRVRHQFVYGGAARTLRWSSADVQTQNMPRPIKEVEDDYQRAVDLIMAKAYQEIKSGYPSVLGMIASSLRMAFQAETGQKFVVCDLNAIENRGLGYLARCPGILDVFKHKPEDGGDPYIAFGTKMFKKAYEELWAAYKAGDKKTRTNCKPAVLGAGYGLGGGELYVNSHGDTVRGGLWGYAKGMGIEIEQQFAHDSVKVFRASYPEVPQLWKDLEHAFKWTLRNGDEVVIGEVTWDKYMLGKNKWRSCYGSDPGTLLKFDRVRLPHGGWMIRIKLPSGRCLHYLNADTVSETVEGADGRPWTRDVIYYDGIEHSATFGEDGQQLKRKPVWGRVKTYGGKLTENVVQAFCRDVLLNGMFLADEIGFNIFGMFHDEIGAQVPDNPFGLGLNDLRYCMNVPPPWARTFPLGADGYEGYFYHK